MERKREAKAAAKHLAVTSSIRRRSVRLQTSGSPSGPSQIAAKPGRLVGGRRDMIKPVSPARPAADRSVPIEESTNSNQEVEMPALASLTLDVSSVGSTAGTPSGCNSDVASVSLSRLDLSISSPLTPPTAPTSLERTPSFVGIWRHALPLSSVAINAAPVLSLHDIRRSIDKLAAVDGRVIEGMLDAFETFWDFDAHLSYSISNWQLSHDVYLLGSGLGRLPMVVIADGPSLAVARNMAANIIFTSLRMSSIATDDYLFENMRAEFNGQRHAFDALRSAAKPRRRPGGQSSAPAASSSTLLPPPPVMPADHDEPRPRSGGQSSVPAASSSTLLPPPPVVPADYDASWSPPSDALPYAAYVAPMNIDSVASHDDHSMVVDLPSPVVASVRPTTMDTGVQTDCEPHIQSVGFPDVPLESLETEDLCRMIRSLSAQVSYLKSLHDSVRPLPSLRADEIPAEMVSQCIHAVFRGHFDMLVAFGSTKHRLMASDVSPDTKDHLESLFQQCHTSLSEMLASLDKGRRSAPDVFMPASPST
ncbi:hypothetical protein B0H16DRAFT_1710640 [Mycena metata]|uniref:Uncharacterized protein n=1 Tax=Mycena metata TaxID=1033252 RepID=A0AAD7KA05_9AGAR|nr:hypothetical protein B0H16DRAFT_1710640 [Mycena metata]